MTKYTHSIVICTQSRSDDLQALLNCLGEVAKVVDSELIVVANSPLHEENIAIRNVINLYGQIQSKQLLISEPGLPRSRNLGLHYANGDILTFLDDDTEVRASYFLELERIFETDPKAVGIAPFVETDVMRWTNPSKVRNQDEILIRKPGSISKAGNFHWINRSNSNIEVSWLPGCAMSYRRCAIKSLQFNQELENGHTGGYALGEDADFSMRLSESGKLIGIGGQSVLHKLSPISRASMQKMEMARGAWLAYLTTNFPSRCNQAFIFARLSINALAIFFGIKSKAGLPKYNLSQSLLRINGYLSERKNPKLRLGGKN